MQWTSEKVHIIPRLQTSPAPSSKSWHQASFPVMLQQESPCCMAIPACTGNSGLLLHKVLKQTSASTENMQARLPACSYPTSSPFPRLHTYTWQELLFKEVLWGPLPFICQTFRSCQLISLDPWSLYMCKSSQDYGLIFLFFLFCHWRTPRSTWKNILWKVICSGHALDNQRLDSLKFSSCSKCLAQLCPMSLLLENRSSTWILQSLFRKVFRMFGMLLNAILET